MKTPELPFDQRINNNAFLPHTKPAATRSVKSFVQVKVGNELQKVPIIKGQVKASDLQSLHNG
jgi:hypothetical protein